MGKVKSRRHRYHLASTKRKALDDEKNEEPNNPSEHNNKKEEMSTDIPTEPLAFNPFAGLKIDASKLSASLPPPEEWDRQTVVTIAKEASKGMNKKRKARLKKQLMLKKLEATRQLELDLKDSKRRQATVITKDLKPLLDSLPQVDLMFHQAGPETQKSQSVPKETTNKHKDRNSMKGKRKQKEMLKDMAIFKQVLDNKAFKANPTETMLNHLTFYVQKEYKDAVDKEAQPPA